ncbi:MAG TPA: hypothetical protein PK467_12820, partial [Candidatus Wallbacteria bacterium]|nr:hypothetical protein [Candidatus Wallbacteria bacterium]
KITGPSFHLERGELTARLIKDVKLFDIPIIKDRIVKIKKAAGGSHFTLSGAGGGNYRSRSVIIASGMRPLSNEIQFFGNGVEITYMGYDFINKMISGFIGDAARNDKKFIIYGNKYSMNLINLVISAVNCLKTDFDKMSPLFLIDADEKELTNDKTFKKYPFLFAFGKIVKFYGNGRLEKIAVESGGRVSCEKADRVLIDYNSFELAPDFGVKIYPAADIFDKTGFVKISASGATKIKGVFAAGDITGPYYSVSRAVAAGITAAFSAYEYVMRLKKRSGGYSLFAYKARNFIPDTGYREIDIDSSRDETPVLSKPAKIKKILRAKFPDAPGPLMDKLMVYFVQYKILAKKDFEEISKLLNISFIELNDLIAFMIDEKLLGIE